MMMASNNNSGKLHKVQVARFSGFAALF